MSLAMKRLALATITLVLAATVDMSAGADVAAAHCTLGCKPQCLDEAVGQAGCQQACGERSLFKCAEEGECAQGFVDNKCLGIQV